MKLTSDLRPLTSIFLLTSVLCSLTSASPAADYTLAEPVRIGVEAQQYAKTIDATGYSVEQLSVLRLPGGGLQCRATLSVTDGSNTYRRVLTADQAQIVAAIGPQAMGALLNNMGTITGEILKKQASEF